MKQCLVILGLVLMAVSAQAASPTVSARVNGVAISHAEVQRLADRIGAHGVAVDKVWDDAVDQLVTWELLSQKAKLEGLAVTPAEVDVELKKFQDEMQTPERYKAALADAKMNETEFRRELQRSALVQKILDKHLKVDVTPAEIEAFYKENAEEFERPEMVRASHILIKIGPDKEASRKRAEAVLARVKKGEDFAAVAKEVSEDPQTKDKGGDLGFFPERPGALAQTAWQMKPGDISEIIESPYGQHILKLIERREAGTVPLKDVSDEIKDSIEDDKRQDLEDAYIDNLKKGAKIEILEKKDKSKAAPGPARQP